MATPKNVNSPPHIKTVVSKLIKGLTKDQSVKRENISADDLEKLDAYAQEVFGSKECKVNSYEGCGSCCNNNIEGSLAHTTCGDMCDNVCGDNPCG